MKTIIKSGRVINPATQLDKITDILVENGIVSAIGDNLSTEGCAVVDASEKWVLPGLIDVHVHLREPGFESKETIFTGARAAAAGGFTTICAMPNTDPVIDNEMMVDYIQLKAQREGCVHVLPIGSITKGQKGEELANIGGMAKAGACAVSEDGHTVMDAGLMKTAMQYANMFELPVFAHCEDQSLVKNGVMHAGKVASLLGLAGISPDAEDLIVARDILLSKSTGAKLHICHLSTRGGVELVRAAKEKGLFVTAEATPHHLLLTDEAVDQMNYDANTKMNPPLREQKDVEALTEALADGTIDVIATDHAPHKYDDKHCEYANAAFGIVGLETAFPLCLTYLVDKEKLPLMALIAKLTVNSARLLGIDKGDLSVGKMADLIVVDPVQQYIIDPETFHSKGKNTPFGGWKVKGKVTHTMVEGKFVYQEGKFL